MMVPEYKNSTVEEVIRCIDENSIQDIPVEDIPAEVEGLPTEFSSVTEKLIRYDAHVKSVNPALSTGEICVYLHVDLEIPKFSSTLSVYLLRAALQSCRRL